MDSLISKGRDGAGGRSLGGVGKGSIGAALELTSSMSSMSSGGSEGSPSSSEEEKRAVRSQKMVRNPKIFSGFKFRP